VLEPLPRDVGTWKIDDDGAAKQTHAEGLVREVRHYYYESANRLVLQVRYRNKESGEIVRVEPEQTVKRKRVRV